MKAPIIFGRYMREPRKLPPAYKHLWRLYKVEVRSRDGITFEAVLHGAGSLGIGYTPQEAVDKLLMELEKVLRLIKELFDIP